MAVGLQATKNDLDQRLGTQALQVLQLLTQWQALKTHVDSMLDADLTALGYVTADVTLIRSISTDIGTILSVFTGAAAQGATPYDFRANLRKVAGMGY